MCIRDSDRRSPGAAVWSLIEAFSDRCGVLAETVPLVGSTPSVCLSSNAHVDWSGCVGVAEEAGGVANRSPRWGRKRRSWRRAGGLWAHDKLRSGARSTASGATAAPTASTAPGQIKQQQNGQVKCG